MNRRTSSRSSASASAARPSRLTHPAAAVALSFVFMAVAILCAELLSSFLGPALSWLRDRGEQSAVHSALAKTITLYSLFVPLLLLLWAWLARFERRLFRTLGFSRRRLPSYGTGWLVGLLMIGGAVGLATALQVGRFVAVAGPAEGWSALAGVLLVYVGWAVQASAEEALYRGWLLSAIGGRASFKIGALVSSLCFAGAHAVNNGFSLLVFINLFLFGLFLALYRQADGTLWGVCAWHTVWNWALGNVFGADVSGSAPEGGRLLHFVLAGPSEWLTGGPFGLEGSLATTAVFLIGIACAAWRLSRSRNENPRSVR
ncbi:CPBP family intramembrane glutamic endopeptidase [Paenibacillus sp. GYB003]|uniref:CPBP family intramembrane glutamic endopeptidase n=1 Tax=Paenibacillus sp. GYB003 TaxID=2994392 RepID=UPI002F96A161